MNKIKLENYIDCFLGVFFASLFIYGNLKDTPQYERFTYVTKYIYQTLGFDQRWGMYGYDYTQTTSTRYIYEYEDGESQALYPRYWKQGLFNPFRFVKMEDFVWYFRDTQAHRQLVEATIRYYCKNPEIIGEKPVAISFQYAISPFPSLYQRESVYHTDRANPDYITAMRISCFN